jgi:Holliday junction DNA helicase RuvA
MIAFISGILRAVGADHAVIETGGVGFQIFAPRNVLGSLAAIGEPAMLYTHLLVREDLLALYGFATTEQRTLFETLLGVTGIGPKVALSMMGAIGPDELRMAVAGGDTARLARIPGIGKKTAERLVLELKGKLDLRGIATAPAASPAVAAVNTELVSMLTSLGFSAAEASAAVNALPADAPPDLEERLRLALRYFGGV